MLSNTAEGRAALTANLKVTGGIQLGTIRQATLLPFPQQQQQALQDAFITGGNLAELADGLEQHSALVILHVPTTSIKRNTPTYPSLSLI